MLSEVFPESKGVVPQKRIEEARRALESYAHDAFVRLDIKDFYPSVSHESYDVWYCAGFESRRS